MKQLVYASTAAEKVNQQTVENILVKSKENNERENLTGFLVFNSGFFLQVLEGCQESVNKVFCKIVRDERHSNVTILSYDDMYERSFPLWTMALATEVKRKKLLYLKYGYANEFNPYQLVPKGALHFLQELSDYYMCGSN